jgi:hypothetical protein
MGCEAVVTSWLQVGVARARRLAGQCLAPPFQPRKTLIYNFYCKALLFLPNNFPNIGGKLQARPNKLRAIRLIRAARRALSLAIIGNRVSRFCIAAVGGAVARR